MNLTNETKRLEISELDSLVLWKALSMYQNAITSNSALADENDSERANWLLAQVIYKSCGFTGTLDGQTVRSIYEDMQ
tara:strand:- start:384 stop:617 length:234 start_codon:yes stop_codon:yes gene_type:complete